MPDERIYPGLPCVDVDDSVAFYEALGFKRTYRQLRPNPYAVVARGDIQIHLFGIEGFVAVDSYATALITLPDPDAWYHDFAAGLREKFGRLPVAGIPRILRPRKRYGTVRGFTVVDPGGNWLRFFKLGDTEDTEKSDGLAGVIEVAARLGDAHGDDALALKTLENGLRRYADAPAPDLARAYLYRAELALRTGDHALAESSLAAARSLDLTAEERAALAEEMAHAAELVAQARP